MSKEIWKDVVGYEGLYQISNMGKIKSLGNSSTHKNKKGLHKKTSLNHSGYERVTLCKNGKPKCYSLHRLVLISFLGESILQVNHKNGIKDDNRLENLEWCTASENIKHSYNILGKNPSYGMLGKKGILNKKSKPVKQYTLEKVLIKRWDSMMDIQRELGIPNTMICCVCRGRQKTTAGYIWKYA